MAIFAKVALKGEAGPARNGDDAPAGSRGTKSLSALLRLAPVAALAVGLGGCSSLHDHRGYLTDRSLTDSILPGVDNRTSVERSLGQPTFKSEFGQPTWFYVSLDTKQKPFTRPRLDGGIVTRVSFDPSGNVRAVDRAGVDKAVRLEPDAHKTKTLGRDRSFFEDLFGNIGQVGALPGATGQQGGGGGRPGGGTGPNGS